MEKLLLSKTNEVEGQSEKDDPSLEIFRKFQKTMLSARWHKNHVARMKRIFFCPVLKNAMPTNDDVHLILRVGLLRVVADGLVNFNRHRAMPEEFEEGFTFVCMQRVERFFDTDFHGKYSF